MIRGKRMEDWWHTAAIRCTIANFAPGSQGTHRPYYFHYYSQEIEEAYRTYLEQRDGVE